MAALSGGMLALAGPASAAPIVLTYDSFIESKQIGNALDAATTIRMDGILRDTNSPGLSAIRDDLTFTAGSTTVSMSAAWLLAPTQVRTVGVNIDLLDSTNTIIASDLFQGSPNDVARSQFTTAGLVPGQQYTLQFTGVADQIGRFQVDLTGGATLPAIPPIPVPAAAPSDALFDTHLGAKTLGAAFVPGSALRIEGDMADDLFSGIVNSVSLTLTGTTLSAGIDWNFGLNLPQRTTGVNVDLFDSTDTLVATDTLRSNAGGRAFSQLATTGLTPGDYRLVFTGNADLGGRYRINLTTDAIAPATDPILLPPTDVAEPATAVLVTACLAGLALARRQSRIRRPYL